jgi:hypothetical protein
MSNEAKLMSGLILILVPTIQFGGTFLLSLFTTQLAGVTDNPARHRMFVAGHAHAGVLVLLALIMQPLVDQTNLAPGLAWAVRIGAAIAPMLISAGFFFAMSPSGEMGPLRNLIYAGALVLAASVLVLGVGLVLAFFGR